MFEDVYGDHAFVTPDIVRWARERLRLTTKRAAARLSVKPERWAAWEKGETLPTMRQAQDLAESLHIPFGYLWLPKPPAEQLLLPDLRTVADESPREPSAELLDLLNDVIWKQRWYQEYQQQEEAEPVPFVGRYSPANSDPNTVAADIRDTFGINNEMRQEATSQDSFLRFYTRRVEQAGILILRSGIVGSNTHRPLDVKEFRGFAISDRLAPLIFINGKDAKVAQIFTLTHEIAHLWFGESGISNPDLRVASARHGNGLERLCNIVAAETLVPQMDLMHWWNDDIDAMQNVQDLAKRYKVSRPVILRRAHDLGKVASGLYSQLWRQLAATTSTAASTGDGGDPYALIVARNGRALTAALLASLAEGKVSSIDAAQLLNVKASSLDRLSAHVLGN